MITKSEPLYQMYQRVKNEDPDFSKDQLEQNRHIAGLFWHEFEKLDLKTAEKPEKLLGQAQALFAAILKGEAITLSERPTVNKYADDAKRIDDLFKELDQNHVDITKESRSSLATKAGYPAHAFSDSSGKNHLRVLFERKFKEHYGKPSKKILIGGKTTAHFVLTNNLVKKDRLAELSDSQIFQGKIPLYKRPKNVVVIENGNVFRMLAAQYPELTMISSDGSSSPSVKRLCEELVTRGTKIYYLGDLDIPGLEFAQSLYDAIGKPETFFAIQSNKNVRHWLKHRQGIKPKRVINDQTMTQFHEPIKTQAEAVKDAQKTVEQEVLWDDYGRELKKFGLIKSNNNPLLASIGFSLVTILITGLTILGIKYHKNDF